MIYRSVKASSPWICGLTLGFLVAYWGVTTAVRSQDEPVDHRLDYAKAELALAKAQLNYVEKANEGVAGALFSPILSTQLQNKVEVLETFIQQSADGNANMKPVFVRMAQGELEVAKQRLKRAEDMFNADPESWLRKDEVALREQAVRVAEIGVERVKTLEGADELREWELGQLQLHVMRMEMMLEFRRN